MDKWSYGFLYDWLTYSIRAHNQKGIPVDCVVLTTPNIKTAIGVFNRLGVSCVVSFFTMEPVTTEFDFFEYEGYVSAFCRSFYANVLQGTSIKMAFLMANAHLKKLQKNVSAMLTNPRKNSFLQSLRSLSKGYLIDCSY